MHEITVKQIHNIIDDLVQLERKKDNELNALLKMKDFDILEEKNSLIYRAGAACGAREIIEALHDGLFPHAHKAVQGTGCAIPLYYEED